MDKITSVDYIFHIPVDAEDPTEARRQAHEKMQNGIVGASVCNRMDYPAVLEKSIPEELMEGLREKSPAIQELAELTHMCIYDNNSLTDAIEELIEKYKEKSAQLEYFLLFSKIFLT